MRKNCSSDREKLLKFEAEGRELAKFLRSLEVSHVWKIRTIIIQIGKNDWDFLENPLAKIKRFKLFSQWKILILKQLSVLHCIDMYFKAFSWVKCSILILCFALLRKIVIFNSCICLKLFYLVNWCYDWLLNWGLLYR